MSQGTSNVSPGGAFGWRAPRPLTLACALLAPMCAAAARATCPVDRPSRPISYYADFGDDLIRTFMDRATGQFRPIEKSGFDRYFRRLQAHGVRRLIVWLTVSFRPFEAALTKYY